MSEEFDAEMSVNTMPSVGNDISPADRDVLRRLASCVAAYAAKGVEQDKRELWYRHNALEEMRPVIFCDPENGWNEIILPGALECRGDLARGWEFGLRKEIFWAENIKDDRVIPDVFDVGYVYQESDWGLHQVSHGGGNGGSYVWDAPIKTIEDLDKLHFPTITVDYTATDAMLELARRTFGGILPVRLKTSWWWTQGLTMTLVYLRGLSQMMYDMVDQPELLHRLMGILRDGHMARLDYLQENGLLFLNNDQSYVGSGGFGWSRELPQPDFHGDVRTNDMWGFAESQETVGVSPRMFEEFIYPYQLPLLERFGLNCYGCCEPLDKRWSVVKRFPRLRRISVSPWSNLKYMAESLGNEYILSMKPNPADIARPSFDPEQIRTGLREAINIAGANNCRMEIILKDCHTICGDPKRVQEWTRIAREEAERAA